MSITSNYPVRKSSSQAPLVFVIPSIVIFFLLFLGAPQLRSTFAGDPCNEIEDLDDRAECYEKEIEEAQEDYESTSKKLDELRNKKDEVEGKISNLANEINVTLEEINQLQYEINEMERLLEEINQNIEDRREKLQYRIDLRNKVLRKHYQSGMLNDLEFFASFFSLGNESEGSSALNGFQFATFMSEFNESLTGDSIKLIGLLNTEIKNFESDKAEAEELRTDLEGTQQNLLAAKADLDAKKLAAQSDLSEISEKESGYEEELEDLQSEIDKLSSLQKAVLSKKYGEGTVSGYEAAEYKLPDPPFSPAFAAMSYGAFTHYNGMSQYGAKGRAEAGQDYKKILDHYYDADVKKKDNFPDDIKVDGYGEIDFQKYLYGIAEMPSDWPTDALKAQAIAARSYAYRYAKDGKTICTTQSCQVFLKSKSDNPPDRWKKAVDDTKDMILDDPATTQYSSTTGGYLNQSGWDKDGSWPGDAYEKKAKSPWFYKAWYTESYRDDSSKCGRSTPWLDEEEMADILNAWRVWRKGSSSEKDRISPVTTSCWGGNPYSHNEMREKADKYGDSYKDVNSVSVSISNGGYTSEVRFRTDKGDVTIPGDEFKTVFNLRAPSYVALRSRLFDIEMEN